MLHLNERAASQDPPDLRLPAWPDGLVSLRDGYLLTDSNLDGRIQGNMDIRLNDQGRTESRALAEYLAPIPFKEAYSSHLSRASEVTASVRERC